MTNYFEISLKSPAGASDEIFRLYQISDTIVTGREISEVLNSILLDVEELNSDKVLLTRFSSVNWESLESITSYCELYNSYVKEYVDQVKTSDIVPEFKRRKASPAHLKLIINLCYNRSIDQPVKLNKYKPFSRQVYGETSFELVQQMLENVKNGPTDTFIDLGSGVGQVVLQVAGSTDIKFSRGIELAAYPAECACRMDKEFRRWMSFFGKPYQPYELIKGNFLDQEYRAAIESSTIVFANNYAFDPPLNFELTQIFSVLEEGSRIISSKSFCARSRRLSDRLLNDLSSMVRVTDLNPVSDGVSWTNRPFSYCVHVIDRTNLMDYFHQSQVAGKSRSCRRGRRSTGSSSNCTNSSGGTPNTISSTNSCDGSSIGSAAPSVCGSEVPSSTGFNTKKRRRRHTLLTRKKKRRTIPVNDNINNSDEDTQLAVQEEEEPVLVESQEYPTLPVHTPETSSSLLEQATSPVSSFGMKSDDTSNTDSVSFTPQSQLLADDDCSTPSPPQPTSSLDSEFSSDIPDFKRAKLDSPRKESVISAACSTKVDPSYLTPRWSVVSINQRSCSLPKSRHHHHHHHHHKYRPSYAVKQHFKGTQRTFNAQPEQTRCQQYLDILRESIKLEEVRRNELMDQITKLEASLNELRTQGREQFKDIMAKFEALENCPTAFFTEARQLIHFHRNLESKLSELQNSIHNLTDVNAELLKRQFMLEAQLVDGGDLFAGLCPPPPQLLPEPDIPPTPPPTLAPTTDEDLVTISEHSTLSLVPPTLTPIPGNLIDDLEISNSKLTIRNGVTSSNPLIGAFIKTNSGMRRNSKY